MREFLHGNVKFSQISDDHEMYYSITLISLLSDQVNQAYKLAISQQSKNIERTLCCGRIMRVGNLHGMETFSAKIFLILQELKIICGEWVDKFVKIDDQLSKVTQSKICNIQDQTMFDFGQKTHNPLSKMKFFFTLYTLEMSDALAGGHELDFSTSHQVPCQSIST